MNKVYVLSDTMEDVLIGVYASEEGAKKAEKDWILKYQTEEELLAPFNTDNHIKTLYKQMCGEYINSWEAFICHFGNTTITEFEVLP